MIYCLRTSTFWWEIYLFIWLYSFASCSPRTIQKESEFIALRNEGIWEREIEQTMDRIRKECEKGQQNLMRKTIYLNFKVLCSKNEYIS